MKSKTRYTALLAILPFVVGATSSVAAPHNSGGGGSTSAAPCVMSDFVGGAPYPAGMGPFSDITYPVTGESVTGRVYVQQGSYSGLWLGDPMVGSIVKMELYVDGALVATKDLTARKSGALMWSATSKGTHQLTLRVFSTNYDRTKVCYIDSLPEYPVVI